MDVNLAAAVALVGALSGALGSLARSWLARPKTRAEADNLNAAATVSISADAREWASTFAERADRAERRADQAEHRADQAERRADAAETAADNTQALIVKCYGYVRSLHAEIRDLGGTPPPPPAELETLWRGSLDH